MQKLIVAVWLAACWLMPKLQAQDAADSITWDVDIEQVVVTGQYGPTDLRQAVHQLTVIKRDRIEQSGANNLAQLLSQEAGIRIQQDLVLGSSLQLLGLGGENVRIMLDGVPLIGTLDGSIDLGQINLHNIQRVEIVQGPMSVSYGAEALAGVINLISRKQEAAAGRLELSQQLESRGEQSSSLMLSTHRPSGWWGRLQAGHDWFSGFGPDSLRAPLWSPKRQWFGDAQLGYQAGPEHHWRWQSSFGAEAIDRLGEVRRPQFKPYAFDEFYKTRRSQHALFQEAPLGPQLRLQSTLGLSLYERTRESVRTELSAPGGTTPLLGEQDTLYLRSWMLRSTLAWKARSGHWQGQLGADLRLDQAKGGRIVSEQSLAALSDYALFGTLRYQPTADLSLETGLRATYNNRFRVPLIPSVHLRYQMRPKLSLRASYAQGVRSPRLKELYFYFVDINHFIQGNPSLKPERGQNAQLQLETYWPLAQSEQRISLKAGGFVNYIEDKIDLFEFVETPEGIAPAPADTSTLRYAYFNQALYKNRGLQSSLSGRFSYWHFQLSWACVGYYNPLAEQDAAVPLYTYANEWSSQVTIQPWKKGPSLLGLLRVNDKLITYYPETIDGLTQSRQRLQAGFTQLDLSLQQSCWHHKLKLNVGVRNVLDVRQVSILGSGGAAHTGTDAMAVSLGRSFWVQLVFTQDLVKNNSAPLD